MELRTDVHGGQAKVPDIEHNFGSVYVRFNVQPYEETIDEQTYKGWVYDEWFMSEYEYQMIQQGSIPSGATWSDPLRSIEREHLYEAADRMLMKYTSYAPDQAKAALWASYKANVHATTSQPNYPSEVTYPEVPE